MAPQEGLLIARNFPLAVVGRDFPRSTGFIRGTLPSGWILFQRRAPALFPYVCNDYEDFARLATGYLGPIVLVAD